MVIYSFNKNKMKHLTYIKIMLFSLIFINATYGEKQNLLIGNPFKIGMDGLYTRAKDLLDKATNNGLILETNGAEQVLNLIANVQQIYEKELMATTHVVNNQNQKIMSGITQILDQIQNHTIESASSKILEVALMFPPLGNHPQLTTWTGNVIIPYGTNITVKFKGIFKYASNSGYEPTMKFINDVYKPSEKTETYLSFDIPIAKLSFSQNKVDYLTAILNIPYNDHFWQPKKNAEYKIKIILLPKNSGKFEFIINTFIDEKQTLIKQCDLFWAGVEDLTKYCYPDPGYTIDIATISRTLIGERGGGFGHDHFDVGSDFTKPEVSIGFHIRGDDDESFVAYRITYSMFKLVSVPFDKSLGEETFKWGDSKTYTIADDKATWKAVYTQFDSRRVAFASSSENNPYIRIKQVANQIVVSFAPFD